MDDSSKQDFKVLMDATAEYYQKDRLSKTALQLYFGALQRFSLEQIQEAVSQHIQTPGGQFYPKAADIIQHLEGGELSTDEIIAMARLKATPLGVLCYLQIGSWDLENQTDMFYLRQRAQECLQLLPEWKAKALSGNYSDHDISIMAKLGVNPLSPFTGSCLHSPQASALIQQNVERVFKTERYKFLIGETQENPIFGLEHNQQYPEVSEGEKKALQAFVRQNAGDDYKNDPRRQYVDN